MLVSNWACRHWLLCIGLRGCILATVITGVLLVLTVLVIFVEVWQRVADILEFYLRRDAPEVEWVDLDWANETRESDLLKLVMNKCTDGIRETSTIRTICQTLPVYIDGHGDVESSLSVAGAEVEPGHPVVPKCERKQRSMRYMNHKKAGIWPGLYNSDVPAVDGDEWWIERVVQPRRSCIEEKWAGGRMLRRTVSSYH
jgi:methionine synthase II (cobalamin-independent)